MWCIPGRGCGVNLEMNVCFWAISQNLLQLFIALPVSASRNHMKETH